MSAVPPKLSSTSPSSSFSLGTIVFVLFKHKWKIALVSLLAAAGAGAYYVRSAPVYQSVAKMLVKNVTEVDPLENRITTADVSNGQGETVIRAEIDVLTSWDLAEDVAAEIGPERFAKSGVPAASAAQIIAKGLTATAEKGSNVIKIAFQHADPDLTKLILERVINQYFIKFRKVHRSIESLDLIKTRLSESITALGNLDVELKKTKDGSTLPLSQLTVDYENETAKVKQELDAAKVALAEQRAWLTEVKKYVTGDQSTGETVPDGKTAPDGKTGSDGKATPDAKVAADGKPAEIRRAIPAQADPAPSTAATPPVNKSGVTPGPDVPVRDNAIVAEHQALITKIIVLQGNGAALQKFTPENAQVKKYEADLKALQVQRLNMETKYPYLLPAQAVAGGGTAAGPQVNLLHERGKLASLEARISVLEPAYNALVERSARLAKEAPIIARRERDREIEQKNYESWMASQVKADANSMINSKNTPGLAMVQDASPASLDTSKRDKIVLGIAAGGPVVGAALVLIFGLLLNRSIKRPVELEEHLGVPLMMTIPFFSGKSIRRISKGLRKDLSLTPWRMEHFIRPFAESIRDRLGLYFEKSKITHKPKLIGVTGFHAGGGVSTLAGGLAAALSEVGDGRVLLVDMNTANGKAHSFSDGLPVISLNSSLKLGNAQQESSDNLYLAHVEPAAPGAGSLLLKKLFELIPNLKTSDFDYIVFDLPLLGQTTPAAAMGGLLDTVIVVVEAEANSREEVKRGHRDLIASGANVSTVFNKARAYGPKALVGAV